LTAHPDVNLRRAHVAIELVEFEAAGSLVMRHHRYSMGYLPLRHPSLLHHRLLPHHLLPRLVY
jgi:hypothetical protein